MHREYHKWKSPNLGKDMEFLVFGTRGAKVLIFPTRGARFYEYENLRMTEVLRNKIEAGYLQLYCVDSIDSESFYCWWAHPSGRIQRHEAYERYILEEIYPFMQERNNSPCVIAHGCSLGAFHAANIAFRHPHLFSKLAAFSGRYDLTLSVEYFSDLLDNYYDDSVYFNTPTHYLSNLECENRINHLRNMEIILTIGEADPFRGNNEHLSQILHTKGIDHQLHLWQDRAHRGYYWRRMAPLYI